MIYDLKFKKLEVDNMRVGFVLNVTDYSDGQIKNAVELEAEKIC